MFSGPVARAIGVMCLGVFLLVLNDACAKWLLDRYDPFQIVFMRGLLGLPLIVALILIMHGRSALHTSRPWIHVLRGILAFAATYVFFIGLRHLPLAEATALIFAAPLFVIALSVLAFGERVSRRTWLAVVAGFIGVLMIVQPGVAAFQPASLLVVGAAFFYAVIMIAARWIDSREHFLTMLLYMAFVPTLLNLFVLFGEWPAREPLDIPIFLAMAVIGNLGVALISQAFRMAPSSIVAPFDYTALLWATLLGWLVWQSTPGLLVYAGAAVIIASGTYMFLTRPQQEE